MNKLTECPKALPELLRGNALNLAESLLQSEINPAPKPEIIASWDYVINEWADTVNLLLLNKKHKDSPGSVLIHNSGGDIVLVDNSSARWSFGMAYSEVAISIDVVRDSLQKNTIPIVLALKNAEESSEKYTCIGSD